MKAIIFLIICIVNMMFIIYSQRNLYVQEDIYILRYDSENECKRNSTQYYGYEEHKGNKCTITSYDSIKYELKNSMIVLSGCNSQCTGCVGADAIPINTCDSYHSNARFAIVNRKPPIAHNYTLIFKKSCQISEHYNTIKVVENKCVRSITGYCKNNKFFLKEFENNCTGKHKESVLNNGDCWSKNQYPHQSFQIMC
jgi:hypothetical protein